MTPRYHRLTVSTEEAGVRLDSYLARALPHLSRTAAHRLIADGHALIGGQPAKPRRLVTPGLEIEVCEPAPRPSVLQAEAIPLDVVYEDSDLLVIDKPAGLVVHPGVGTREGTLVNALLAHCSDLSGIGGEERPGIVHRLDRDTSGLLVVAKHDAAHRNLALQLAQRTMERRYLALVLGVPPWTEQTVDAPIGRHPLRRTEMAIVQTGRAARTRFRVLDQWPQAAQLEARLESGRTHQVRVHALSLGLPLLGDPVYGRRRLGAAVWSEDVAAALAALPGQALHAYRLSFHHPADGRLCEFHRAPPAAYESVARLLAAEATG